MKVRRSQPAASVSTVPTAAGQERREHAAEVAGARGEEDAPTERVDRGSAGEWRPLEPGIHQGDLAEIGGKDEHDGDRRDPVQQRARNRHDRGRLAVVDAVVRRDPERGAGDVAIPHRLREVAQVPPNRRVLGNRHPPRLAVAAARCEASVVEDLVERLVGDRLVGESAHRTRGPQRREEFHRPQARSRSSREL
jgi:hypothetical protein